MSRRIIAPLLLCADGWFGILQITVLLENNFLKSFEWRISDKEDSSELEMRAAENFSVLQMAGQKEDIET